MASGNALGDRGHRDPAFGIKTMHGGIRVPDRAPSLGEHPRGGGFAHSDGPGQTKPKSHRKTAARVAVSTSGRMPNQRSNPGTP